MTAYAQMVRFVAQGKTPVAIPIKHDGDNAVWITAYKSSSADHMYDPHIRACTILGLMLKTYERVAHCEGVTLP